MHKRMKITGAGAAAGAVSGLLGAGGGSLLLPLLKGQIEEDQLFLSAPAIMTPICLVSLLLSQQNLDFKEAAPYLLGSFLGGLAARKIKASPRILHKILGSLILLGGGRMLWP